jgi:hypothetical protein
MYDVRFSRRSLSRVDLMKTEVLEERNSSIIRVERNQRARNTIISSEFSVLPRAPESHIPQDGIVQRELALERK